MGNKTIGQLPLGGSVVATDELEKQITANGASQKLTAAQFLTFIENNVTFFSKGFDCQLGFTVNAGTSVLSASGQAQFANGTVSISSTGDVEISNTTKGVILWSPNGTRYRLKVDNAGNLGTEPA